MLIENDGSYNSKNIYVQSTDVDRTLNSAAYNLAGMFPPKGQQIWNESLLWQGKDWNSKTSTLIILYSLIFINFSTAIPVHTVPEKLDHILAMKRPCPKYQKAYDEYIESDEIKSIFKNNQTLIEYLELHSGKELKTLFDLKSLNETLWIENLKGFK